MSAALRRSFSSLQIPNYRRYFAGQIVSLSGNWMQMVAEMWLILELTGSGVAVGVTSALQFLPVLLFGAWGGVLADRWPKRSLLLVTQAAMALPALALWGLTATGAIVPWMVFALVFVRGAVNSIDNPTRQSFVIEMVGADQVVNAVSLNSVIVHAARILGPASAGVLIATVGVAPCFLLQRVHLRRHDRRPAGDGPGPARPAELRPGRPRRGARGAALPARRALAADPAGDDDRDRHPGVQLPGPAAAARALHLRRRRRRLHRARGGDGGRLGRRGAGHRRPRAGDREADRRLGRRLRPLRPTGGGRPQPAAGARRAGPARLRQRHLRRRRQLDPAARRQPGDAGPGDGAVLGRLPRLDPDRRPGRRLARRGRRPALRPGARRRRRAGRRGSAAGSPSAAATTPATARCRPPASAVASP